MDAGSVYTILGGKFNAAGFEAFDSANKKAVASSTEAEAKMRSFSSRLEGSSLKAMDSYSKSSKEASKNLSQLGSFATKTAAVGIVAVGAAAVYAAAKATSFNREMLRLHTQAGATTDEVTRFKGAVLSLAGTVPQGPKELSEGLYHIVSAGFKGSEALRILKASAEGAALGGANLEDTANALVGTLASQVKGVKGAADAQGQLNDIVGAGNLRFEDLDKAVATGVLPTFAQAGLTLKDFGASLATITDNSTPANVTATRLRMTIAQMVSPTKAAAKELATIGIGSSQLANDLRKPNGVLVAVEDLKHHLQDSGKTAVEQDQILSNAFGRGKSSATIITLVGEIDRLRAKYQQLGTNDGPQKLAKSWSEFQHSEAAAFGELKSGAEAFAITVSDVLLPSLSKLSRGGAKDLSSFISSGGAEKVGHDIEQAFSTVGTVFQDLAPPIEATAKALLDVGKAAGLGNGTEIATLLAGFLAFRGATFVAPILSAIAGGITEIGVAAATADSVAAFGGDLVALAGGPVGALAIGVGILAGGFIALNSGLFSSTSAAEKNAEAFEHDKAAVEGLANATQSSAEAHTSAERAELRHKEAGEQLKRVEKEVADGTIKGTAAQNALLNARLNDAESSEAVAAARKKANGALQEEQKTSEKAKNTLGSREREILKEIDTTNKQITNAKETAAGRKELGILTEKLKEQEQSYANAAKVAAQYEAQLAVAEESRHRIQAGKSAIEPKNAVGVKNLQDQLFEAGAPQKVVAKYELDDQAAQAELGNLAAHLSSLGKQTFVAKVLTTAPTAAIGVLALTATLHGIPPNKVLQIISNARSKTVEVDALHAAIRGVPASKIAQIETNAGSEAQKVAELKAQIAALESKSITVTTVLKTVGSVAKGVNKFLGNASGRGPSGQEVSLVGEGNGPEYVVDGRTGEGTKVDKPTLMGLAAQDYVVPLEDRYRGRALGLFASLANDLEIPGYKTGKKGKKGAKGTQVHRPIPGKLDPLSIPVEEVEARYATAQSEYHKDTKKRESIEKQIKTAERTLRYASKKSRPRAQARVTELQNELAKVDPTAHKHKMDLLKKEVGEAKAFAAKVAHEESLINQAANDMKLADGHNDETGYQAAKGRRGTALAKLQELIAQQKGHAHGKFLDELNEHLGARQVEGQEAASESFSEPALSPTELAQQKGLEEKVALAALTEGLGDDTTAAQNLVSFFETALGSAQARGAGVEAITELAGDVKTARSNLESLSGNGTNENRDLQAQIGQERERREVAERSAAISNQALEVFGGSGDIGAGGRNAQAAVVVHQTNNMLHPSDPEVLLGLGKAAAAGFELQGSRQASRIQVGP